MPVLFFSIRRQTQFASIQMRRHLNRFAMVIMLFSSYFTPYAGIQIALAAKAYEIGIVIVDDLKVHSEPGRHGFLQKQLKRGTQVKIINRLHGWIQIFHGGEVGFIRDDAHLVKIVGEKDKRTEKDKKKPPADPEYQIETLKKKASDIHRKIEKGETSVKKYSRKEIDIINRLDELDFALYRSRKRLASITSEIAYLDKKIAATKETSKDLMKQIKANESYVSKRLVALYKLNWIGQLHVLGSAETVHELIQRQEALERILTHDENVRKALEENRRKFKNLLAELNNHKTQKDALRETHNEQLKRMSADRSNRKKLLAHIRTQKSLELAAIASLKQSAKELDQKIQSLTREFDSATKEKKALVKPIATYKGLLNMPVKGKIIHLFGPYKNKRFNVINFRSGIDIAAEMGEPVRAVFSGKIVYASWFKGYGNMIIIDHGRNFHTVYAHVEDIFKAKGDTVETGEVIATVGDTGSISGPQLHFEVRHHGKPLNPLIWLNVG